MANNLVILRLLTEEVMGELIQENNENITLKNPVRIVVVPSKADPKNPSVGFAPFAQWSDDKEFKINRAVVVAMMTPVSEFVNQYNSAFGGIVVPDSKLIVP